MYYKNLGMNKLIIKQIESDLISALNGAQQNTVGILKIYGKKELVVEDDGVTITTFSVGDLGGLSTSHYSKDQYKGLITYIPKKYKTLSKLLESPQEFYAWMKENKL